MRRGARSQAGRGPGAARRAVWRHRDAVANPIAHRVDPGTADTQRRATHQLAGAPGQRIRLASRELTLMDDFRLKDGELYAEDVPLSRIAAEVGTPVYVYSRSSFERHARDFREGLNDCGRIHLAYAVKANPNLAVLRVMANAGYGADVVSGGELERALAAGMAAKDVVFSGVGKTRAELTQGLDRGIGQFNLEHEAEGVALSEIAVARGLRAPCVLRVNPDIDAGTHAKISTGKAENKFGVAIADAPAVYARLAQLPGLDLRGVASHIGSQVLNLAPMEATYARIGDQRA